MEVGETLKVRVRCADDIHCARHDILKFALALPFTVVDRSRLDVAIMELGSNLVKYGGGGSFLVRLLKTRPGLRIICEDAGPGIADLAQAIRPGCSTTDSFGDGLATVQGTMDAFAITSELGRGTRVEVEKWPG
ncbi:MAG: ATP-binding protein [Sideroxyarcus sp.]|nr:ATP-binding protein [Sideroxyarcus sp.]